MDEGGCWTRYYGGDGCQCPTRDSGKACSLGSVCEGSCVAASKSCEVATTGTCSVRRPMIGCFCALGSDGKPSQICVD